MTVREASASLLALLFVALTDQVQSATQSVTGPATQGRLEGDTGAQ